MSAGQNSIIQYGDYNTIQNLVYGVLYSTSTGYGQNPADGTVAINGTPSGLNPGNVSTGGANVTTDIIRAAQWNALFNDIQRLSYHQLNAAPTFNGTALSTYIDDTTTYTTHVSDTERSYYLLVAQGLTSSNSVNVGGVTYPGCYADSHPSQRSTGTTYQKYSPPLGNPGTAITYGTYVTHTITCTWTNYAAAKSWFNSGSYLYFSASLTSPDTSQAGDVGTIEYDWQQLLSGSSGMGTVYFRNSGTTSSTYNSGASTNLGFNSVNASEQTIFTKQFTDTLYLADKVVATVTGNSSTPNVLTFKFYYYNNYTTTGDPTNQGPRAGRTFSKTYNVDGLLTTNASTIYASGSYVSATAYNPSIAVS